MRTSRQQDARSEARQKSRKWCPRSYGNAAVQKARSTKASPRPSFTYTAPSRGRKWKRKRLCEEQGEWKGYEEGQVLSFTRVRGVKSHAQGGKMRDVCKREVVSALKKWNVLLLLHHSNNYIFFKLWINVVTRFNCLELCPARLVGFGYGLYYSSCKHPKLMRPKRK